jgi:histidine ammonia-lyase
MKSRVMVLNGNTLTTQDIYFLAHNPFELVKVSKSSLELIKKSHKFLNQKLDKEIIYGVNTGFGPMASYIINKKHLVELQKNLIRSHSVGMGKALSNEYVLASMAVRLNTLVKGVSGVSPLLIKQLQTYINKRIIPVIPEHGAVGTSGDLVQLAHIALTLIGEGTVYYNGKYKTTTTVLRELNIKPYKLKPKEGLALINGTSAMAGIAALACIEARRIISLAIKTAAFSLELVQGFKGDISEKLHNLRPHKGQIIIAQCMRDILSSSRLLKDRNSLNSALPQNNIYKISSKVQEIYSLRCAPQILGPIYDILVKTNKDVETEINSATDNPIIDLENELVLHGGNFHGDYIAAAIDQLKISLVKLSLLSERRINFFLNENINKCFPPFVNLGKLGFNLGLQGLQFVATSTAAQNQTLAFPHHIHSISTNADNQDVVSMGSDAALLAIKVIENTYILLTIELIVLAQVVDFLNEKTKLSHSSRELFEKIRGIFPKITQDKVIVKKLELTLELVKKESILNIQW